MHLDDHVRALSNVFFLTTKKLIFIILASHFHFYRIKCAICLVSDINSSFKKLFEYANYLRYLLCN
jgi:hypothetical protein